MYVDSFSRFLITCVVTLTLSACGGGGGGGGGGLIGGGSTTSTSSGGGTGTGSMTLEISGMVDASGNPDNILAGNEIATLTATVVEDGQPADVVVLFETSIGRLVTSSAQSTDGTASVQITGNGTPGAATVTAKATLSNGVEVEASIVVQNSADAPTLVLFDSTGAEASTVEVRAAETAVITARVRDWDGTALEGVGINFELTNETALSLDLNSGATDSNGELNVTVTGTQESGTGTLTASSTFSEFDLEDSIPANGLGVNEELNNVRMDTIDVGSDGSLAGNEKTTVIARVTEDGVAKNGIVVEFSTNATGGTLATSNATTANDGTSDGVASVQLIGDATAGTAVVTATATLSNGIAVSQSQTVQTSSNGPTMTLVARNAAGATVTTFGANQNLTLEATIVDHDGSALDATDAGANVTFGVDSLGTVDNTSDVTEFGVCPVNGIKENTDCAFVNFTSNSAGAVGSLSATATINNVVVADDIQVTNTGINSGSPDQDSFSITRIFDTDNTKIATSDILALEGDLFNNNTSTVQVDLADFFNNPVPDGTLVEFRTELGDIGNSCTTLSGSCSVTFTTGDPRTPIDTEVSFKNLDDDNCPSKLVLNERVTIDGSGNGLTDFRVDNVKRVALAGTPTTVFATSTYDVTADGIDCTAAPCSAGASVDITYERLWLDELDDKATAHVIADPGQATEPFLNVKSTPCLADERGKLVVIQGTIDPAASTTVTGVGTEFRRQLAVGDRIKVTGEIRTVTAIASDTSLTVDTAFSDNLNDVSPERIAAPAYFGGMGQPYGAKSTILAFALGEESFVDVNGNDEYDFGETFFDLTEVFMDKNTDGVLGDVDGNSASVTSVGPYSDAGTGAAPGGGKRDKSSPFCYGPQTIVGNPSGSGSSTEQDTYCYQDGGEEEFFIDADEDGIMDVGNGIYNGSRCLTPLQDSDGDSQADDTVCTTDLVNISRSVEILMAGTPASVAFRTTSGGANGGGEIINQVELVGGSTISNTAASPPNWASRNTTAVPDTPTVQKGADVNTGLLAGGSRDVELFTLSNAFTRTDVNWTLTFEVTRTDANTGTVEVFASGTKLTFDSSTSCGDVGNGVTDTCTVSNFTVAATGDLIVASAHDTNILGAEINNFSITGVTTGTSTDFRITNGETVTSNDNSNTALTEFGVGDTINATTVFGGVSERLGNGGAIPVLSTTLTTLDLYFTDRYNGELPRGTTIKVESDNSAGCTIASVGGVLVNSNAPGSITGALHSGSVEVGVTTGTSTRVVLTTGFNSGSVTVTVTPPANGQTIRSISCEL